ncbi:MAG: hybrid sensor histidine kinase/response regulator [Chloroflexota bacterium]|nr:MAG: hybrid sensor histidine kinase/response regulator [Chloroflexota bacterium]
MSGTATILIVDDERVARDLMEGFLYSEGYNLVFANSGVEVLTHIETINPDVILLDVMMPVVDGFEVCRRLKADERWQHIPIILVTALVNKEDLVTGFAAGANDFLRKPVSELELRARVRSMVRIKQQYDRLEATLLLRENLAQMIVHDVRTPLAVIMGFSELLLLKNANAPETLTGINEIKKQAHQLDSFLNDLLMLTKVESDQPILNRSLVEVNQLIQQVQRTHKIIAQSRKIELVFELPAESRPICLDANMFQRLLDNLISNALKFSPANSHVTVRVEYLEPKNEASDSPQLRVKVIDEGPGIAPEHYERIFDKFEIVELKLRGVPQVGLGLAFCKMVTEAHGGRIYVEPNLPTGSIFIVEI